MAIIIFLSFNFYLKSNTNSNVAISKIYISEINRDYDADTYYYFESLLKSRMLTRDITQLAKTDYILNKLITNLEEQKLNNLNKNKLRDSLKLSIIEKTSIIEIKAEYEKSEDAILIVNELSKLLKEELKNTFGMDYVSIFDTANSTYNKNVLITLKNIIFWILLSFVLGIIIISYKYKFNFNSNLIKGKHRII
jgi:capsular polysaccharide biosynthesis protein